VYDFRFFCLTAYDSTQQNFKLQYDLPLTFSLKCAVPCAGVLAQPASSTDNMLFASILKMQLFPASGSASSCLRRLPLPDRLCVAVMNQEESFYMSKLNKFGVPLVRMFSFLAWLTP
jgi:hypothetical protein